MAEAGPGTERPTAGVADSALTRGGRTPVLKGIRHDDLTDSAVADRGRSRAEKAGVEAADSVPAAKAER